jgi:hypothetical protein
MYRGRGQVRRGISVSIDDLNSNSKVTGISIAGSSPALRSSYAQLSNDTAALGKIQSNYALNVTNATASNAVALSNSNPRASSIEVVDTSANVLTAIDDSRHGQSLGKSDRIGQHGTHTDSIALDSIPRSAWGKIDGG